MVPQASLRNRMIHDMAVVYVLRRLGYVTAGVHDVSLEVKLTVAERERAAALADDQAARILHDKDQWRPIPSRLRWAP